MSAILQIVKSPYLN